MMANQTKYSRLEQRSIIKFLIAGKGKSYEIYIRMCDVYKEVCFSPQIFTNRPNKSFATTNISRKTVSWSGNTPALR